MKLYHFQKTLDFFSSRLIFANLENQAPIAAEKVENQEKPGEKQKTPEQKEGQIMKEYKILENRLEKGKQKLEACRKILETIPKGEHLDRAKNLYQEAEKLLNGIGQDLPKLEAKKGEELMSELSTNVEEGIEAASDKAFSLKADVLMKAGINIGESASDENKALLAIDLPLITQSAEKIRRLGVTSDQLGPLLNMAARNNKERGLQEMTHYIEAAKNPNITAQDAGKFYLDGLELKELQDMVAQKMDAIKKYGFDGTALLGAVWNGNDPVNEFKKLQNQWQNQDLLC